MIAYANVIVPEPRVAAISENIDPLVPPALNFLFAYRPGERSYNTKQILNQHSVIISVTSIAP